MKAIVRAIDSISEWTAKVAHWACVALVLVLSFEVFMRYVLERPTIWSYELSTMLGVTIIIMGLAYAHRCDDHVRIDILYRLLSLKGRAIIDAIGSVLFFSPLIIALTCFSAYWLWHSWSVSEILTQTYWYPPAWPIRAVMFLGLFLFFLQGVAQLVRGLRFLKGMNDND